jgi:hypothetical protein
MVHQWSKIVGQSIEDDGMRPDGGKWTSEEKYANDSEGSGHADLTIFSSCHKVGVILNAQCEYTGRTSVGKRREQDYTEHPVEGHTLGKGAGSTETHTCLSCAHRSSRFRNWRERCPNFGPGVQ